MSTAAEEQQHPLLNARRRRFVEEDANASMAEILTWGSVPAYTDPEAVGHGMKTRSQAAAAEQTAGTTMVEKAATALLRQKQRERERAAATEAPPQGAIASPWASKTLQRPARRAGRKPPQPQAVLAHRSSKALFPYPHTPGKKEQQEEQAAVQGVTRGLSNTALARRYRVPVFGAGSPTSSESAAVEAAVVAAKTPVRKSTSSKGKESSAKAGPAAAAAAVVARTPVTGKAGSRSRRGSVERGAGAAVNPETLASVEAGFRSFVAAMEKEKENGRASSYEQHRRRHTRSSSSSMGGGGGNVLASTPAKPKSKEAEKEEFVMVEHADAPAAEVAKTAAAAVAAAAAAVANESIGEAFGGEDVGRSEAAAQETEEKGAGALTTTVPRSSSRAARRRNKGKKAYDEAEEGSDEDEGSEMLKTDPRAYRSWVEKIPPAGTKVVKGLSVAECLSLGGC